MRPVAEIPRELGRLGERDAQLVKEMRLEVLLRKWRGLGYLKKMEGVEHPVRRLLRQYRLKGVPVKVKDAA